MHQVVDYLEFFCLVRKFKEVGNSSSLIAEVVHDYTQGGTSIRFYAQFLMHFPQPQICLLRKQTPNQKGLNILIF